MKMGVKFVSFILMLTVVLVQARQNFWGDLIFSQKAIINYIFPKDPGIVRVRKPEEVITTVNNVTTMDFIGLVERHGYSAEEHYVTTVDGYILTIHRISGSPLSKGRQRKKVIFFQSGFLLSSDLWVIAGPDKDLAFLLADKGYDIWLGNYRGNTYCRSHIKLSPRDRDFWQYSYHEIGTRDLPAMIDYVLTNTKQKSLRYIGFSMGTILLFILLSTRPEYNAKVKLGVCFAPIAVTHEMPAFVEFLHTHNIPKFLEDFFNSNEIYEFALSSTTITLARTLCADRTITQIACIALIFLMVGSDPAQLNTTALPEILSYAPAGTSTQLFLHCYQYFVTKKLQSFDYGYFGNYKQYGQMTPIMYDLSKVTIPLAIFYGANDAVVPVANVLETYKHLPNVILLEEITHKLFSHIDFLIAIDVKTLVYDRVIELFQKIDNN